MSGQGFVATVGGIFQQQRYEARQAIKAKGSQRQRSASSAINVLA